MDFRIRWTVPAADDFEDLARRIEEKSDLVEARKVALEIYRAIEGLKAHPYIRTLAECPIIECVRTFRGRPLKLSNFQACQTVIHLKQQTIQPKANRAIRRFLSGGHRPW